MGLTVALEWRTTLPARGRRCRACSPAWPSTHRPPRPVQKKKMVSQDVSSGAYSFPGLTTRYPGLPIASPAPAPAPLPTPADPASPRAAPASADEHTAAGVLQGLGRARGELAGIGGADPLVGALAAGTSAQAEVRGVGLGRTGRGGGVAHAPAQVAWLGKARACVSTGGALGVGGYLRCVAVLASPQPTPARVWCAPSSPAQAQRWRVESCISPRALTPRPLPPCASRWGSPSRGARA